jgi:hypothetical protein
MIHCLKRSHKFPTSALLLGKEKSQFAEWQNHLYPTLSLVPGLIAAVTAIYKAEAIAMKSAHNVENLDFKI